MIRRASVSILLALAGCMLSPDLVAQLGDDNPSESTETGQQPDPPQPEPSCIGDCPCTGDFCNQSCPPDFQPFCDMECPPGAICNQTCESSSCSSDCFEGSSCYQQCSTGECTMDCHGGFECGLECVGPAPCSMSCEDTSACHMNCPSGNCTMFCVGSQCTIEQCPGGCTIFCDANSLCAANCEDPMGCTIQYF